jgi:hypothetical protein
MANENKQAIVTAIWENPERAFNCRFRQSGRYLENVRGDEYAEQGKIRLALTRTGENIMVFYNGSSRDEKTDVFTYLERYVLNTAGFGETLQRLSEIYGVTLRFSEEQRRKINRVQLAREVCPCLIESLRKNPTGQAGTYITEQRGLQLDGVHFGELTADSLNRAKEHLRNRGFSYTVEDLKALGLTEWHAQQGYNVVIPYYRNGNVEGFILRNTTNNAELPKYLYSQELGRGGYCDRLRIGKPAFVVEGQMDAIRLIQAYATDADAPNVIAMGGAKISDDIAALLKAHNIDCITYVPDVEFTEQGERKTKITNDAIQAFQAIKVDEEPVIRTLYVSELNTPKDANLNGYKIDADTYGKEYGNDELTLTVEGNATDWYIWELKQLEEWESNADSWDSWRKDSKFRDEFKGIYRRADVWERQPIRDYIKGNALYSTYGVTPQALDEVDEWNRGREYNNRVKAISTELTKAIEDGANPVVIADIAEQLSEAQATNSRDAWDASVNRTFAERLARLKQQPVNLSTKWELGTVRKGKPETFRATERIEFTPADITVFCAPTSHGKTMILFQSALDMVQAHSNKTFLYVSCEESDEQLLERALNAYIPIPNTLNGLNNGEYCFMSRTRRKTIQAALYDDIPPLLYANTIGHYETLKEEIDGYVKQYENTVDKRLKLIHTDASTESICSNITRFIREAQERGVEVGAVFVDYMQLLTTDNKHFSRHDELKTICKALSNCAKKNAVPVVIAAQLNREIYRNGIDDVSVANIGEGADIERIAKDVFLVWQVDKTPLGKYNANGKETDEDADNNTIVVSPDKVGIRANRIFSAGLTTAPNQRTLKAGYIYVEHLKARYGQTGGWGLFPYDGESGRIGENNKEIMAK